MPLQSSGVLGCAPQSGEPDSAVSPPCLSLQVAMSILSSGRFTVGSAVVGILKKLIGRSVQDSSPLHSAVSLLPALGLGGCAVGWGRLVPSHTPALCGGVWAPV